MIWKLTTNINIHDLGACIINSRNETGEINIRIEIAGPASVKVKQFFTNSNLKLELAHSPMLYIFCPYVWNGDLDTLATEYEKQEFLESEIYKRMFRISWIEHLVTDEILLRMYRQRELLFKRRKRKYFRYVMRDERYDLL